MCIRVSFPRCPDREHHPRLPRLQFKNQTRHNPARKPRVFSHRAGYAGVGLKTEKMWSHVTRFALPHPLRLLAKKKKSPGTLAERSPLTVLLLGQLLRAFAEDFGNAAHGRFLHPSRVTRSPSRCCVSFSSFSQAAVDLKVFLGRCSKFGCVLG